MTPTPSAREREVVVTPEWIAGVRINWGLNEATPNEAANQWHEMTNGAGVPCGIVAALGHALDAYDALAAEREALAAEVARRDALSAEAMRLFSSLTACTGIERALAEDAIEQRRRAAAAEREREALRADAERWRYVRDHGYVVTMGVTLPSGEQVGGGRVGDVYATGCVDAMMALDRDMLDGEARG